MKQVVPYFVLLLLTFLLSLFQSLHSVSGTGIVLKLVKVDNSSPAETLEEKVEFELRENETNGSADFNFTFAIPTAEEDKVLLKLVCTSNLPVEFKYFGQGTPLGLSSTDRRTIKSSNSNYYFSLVDPKSPAKNVFVQSRDEERNSTFFTTNFFFVPKVRNTGNYSCCHPRHSGSCISAYIFIPGKHKFLLNSEFYSKNLHNATFGIYSSNRRFNAGNINPDTHNSKDGFFEQDFNFEWAKTEESRPFLLKVEQDAQLITFPCATSRPDANVSFSSVPGLNPRMIPTFDPKSGFNIPINDLLKDHIQSKTIFKCSVLDKDGKDEEKLEFIVEFQKGTMIHDNGQTLEVSHNPDRSEFSCQPSKDSDLNYGLVPCLSSIDCLFSLSRLRNSIRPAIKSVKAGEQVKWKIDSDPMNCNGTNLELLRKCRARHLLGFFYCAVASTSNLNVVSRENSEADFKHVFYFKPNNSSQVVLFSSLEDWRPADHVNNSTFLTLSRSQAPPGEDEDETMLKFQFLCIGSTVVVTHEIIWLLQSPEGEFELLPSYRDWTDFSSGYIYSSLEMSFSLENATSVPTLDSIPISCSAPLVNSPNEWITARFPIEEEDEAGSKPRISVSGSGAIGAIFLFNILIILLYMGLAFGLLRKFSYRGPMILIGIMQITLVLTLFLFGLCFPQHGE